MFKAGVKRILIEWMDKYIAKYKSPWLERPDISLSAYLLRVALVSFNLHLANYLKFSKA